MLPAPTEEARAIAATAAGGALGVGAADAVMKLATGGPDARADAGAGGALAEGRVDEAERDSLRVPVAASAGENSSASAASDSDGLADAAPRAAGVAADDVVRTGGSRTASSVVSE